MIVGTPIFQADSGVTRMEKEQEITRSSTDPWKGDPDFMASLARGLEVLQAFTPQRRLMSVSQISQRTGIPRAAVRRCLYTLSKLGFVYAEDGKNYELRPRVLSLGHNWLGASPLANAAQPVLRQLSQTLNESCSMAILDGDDILYIARASTSRIMTIDLHVGSRLPASTTSMGRVLLSGLASETLNDYLARLTQLRYTSHTLVSVSALREELARVRQQGYAINDQELEIGLRSLAVPLTTPDGRIAAALNVGVHAGQVSAERLHQHHLPLLRSAAEEISLLLHDSP
ncbi:IclR family transcriptional regulator [Serratia marcescens]|nr:hypothetical protein P812_02809 [Serratia marcescens BIDMC 50]ONK20119.1 Pca regulon regulatory protein [Serratia sp. S119]CAI1716020.1 p-hydroxybenzoate hydroxylase transcriptional activator [Serratia marcescens]CAI2116909.1 p-hydroxybenzoate hydroxylase transcriptional activator [Serratia marcescens]BEM58703.1 IclR family transcriptional regulator [Serratia marcescens]